MRLLRQDSYALFKAVLTEVNVESKRMVQSMVVNQGKTGAINEAEVFVIVPDEDVLCCSLDRLTDTKDSDPSLVEVSYEIDGSPMTDFGADECIGLGENEIGR